MTSSGSKSFASGGVTVERLKDQSRPFAFAVKSGGRCYCLSGCTEQEASEWMDRIQVGAWPGALKPPGGEPGGEATDTAAAVLGDARGRRARRDHLAGGGDEALQPGSAPVNGHWM